MQMKKKFSYEQTTQSLEKKVVKQFVQFLNMNYKMLFQTLQFSNPLQTQPHCLNCKDKQHSTNTDFTSVGSCSAGKQSSRLSKSSPISSESSRVSTLSGTKETAGWGQLESEEVTVDWGMLGKVTEEKQEGIDLDQICNLKK